MAALTHHEQDPVLTHHEQDLVLYIDSTGEMYEAHNSLRRNLIGAKKRGDYDRHAAVQAYENRVNDGIKRYKREINRSASWDRDERHRIAEDYVDGFESEYDNGELEWLGGPPRQRRGNPEQPNAKDIEKAPMFTVFGGNRGRGHRIRKNQLPMSGSTWIVTSIDTGMADDVEEELQRREIYGDIGDVIQRDDETAARSYDDDNAAADAIRAGYTLVKIPDAMPGGIGDKYYRMYVLDKMKESRNRVWYEPLDDNQIDWLTGNKPRPRAASAGGRRR